MNLTWSGRTGGEWGSDGSAHLSAWAATASAYYAFWQAYAGGLDVKDIEDQFGVVPGLIWHAVAERSKWTGHFRRVGARYRLTQGGFDRYHDVERWSPITLSNHCGVR
jgi:hypothetical protein